MQYCSLQHQTLLSSPVRSTTGCCFCSGSASSFFLELFLHCSPVAYWVPTDLWKFIFQCPIFLPFHTVHGVLKARILKWLNGIDLIECLMNYGRRFLTLYRRQGSRPSPWKKKCKKAKWLSAEALQMKRREAKSKGEKERYKHLNAEFQRIARRDKKALVINAKK